MKRSWVVCNVLGLAAILLLLAGCGKGEETPDDVLVEVTELEKTISGDAQGAGDESTEGSAGAGESAGMSWRDDHEPLCSYFEDAIVRDGVVYGYYMEGNGTVVVSQDIRSGAVLNEVVLSGEMEPGNMTADDPGNIYVSGAENFWKVSADGGITAFENFVLEDLEDDRSFVEPKGIYVDSEGRFYLQYGMSLPASVFYDDEKPNVYSMADRIYIKDSQLNSLFYIQIPSSRGSQLLSFSFDEEGQPVILAKEEGEFYLCGIDFEKKEMADRKSLDSQESWYFSEDVKMAFAESGFVYCSENELYRYDYDKKVQEKLLNLSSCGILAEDILYLGMNGNTIEIVDNYDKIGTRNSMGTENPAEGAYSMGAGDSVGGLYSMGTGDSSGGAHSVKASEYVAITEGESSKATITLGVMMDSEELERVAASYNRFSGEGRVVIEAYYRDGGGEFDKALEQLELDIVSGRAPDIIEVSMVNTDILTDKGIFADLYSFMDADPEFGRDMLLEAVRKSYERDGHLYSCGSAFQLHTVWGLEEVVQGRYGISMKELQQMLESRGKNINAVYGFSADEPILTTLCTFAMDEFIDWDRGTCDFSSEYMEGLLDFVSKYSGYGDWSLVQGIRNGDILLTIGLITSVADYQLQKEIYGGEISFVGYPSVGRSGTALSIRSNELAINAMGARQETAWDFVKFYMQNGYDGQGFPTLQEDFDAAMQAAMEDEFVDTVDGTYKVLKEVYTDAQGGYLEVYAASQADVDAVIQLIERADARYKYNTDIQNIINEEAESYFLGQKDFRAVADIIESRVGIYLGEHIQ